jgi:hypothetical protein
MQKSRDEPCFLLVEIGGIVLMNFIYLSLFCKIHLRALVPITSLRGAFATLLGGELRLLRLKNAIKGIF